MTHIDNQLEIPWHRELPHEIVFTGALRELELTKGAESATYLPGADAKPADWKQDRARLQCHI